MTASPATPGTSGTPGFDNLRIALFDALSALGDLPLEDLEALISALHPAKHPVGACLVQEGDAAQTLYFVGAGRLVQQWPDGRRATLTRGEMAGWPEVFIGGQHAARLLVEREAILYELTAQQLHELMVRRPVLAHRFLLAVGRSTGAVSRATGSSPERRVIALVFAQTLGERLPEVEAQLRAALPAQLRIEYRDCAGLCALLGSQPDTQDFSMSAVADAMADLESQADHLILAARPADPQAWTQRMLQAADIVVYLTCRTAPAPEPWLAERLTQRMGRLGLVLVSDPAPLAGGQHLPELFAAIRPDWHYQLASRNTRRWQSVARMSLGRARNLVLSGGGAFGAIHIGMLKAMAEADYPIDSAGGTSVGACVAVGIALGFSADEMNEHFKWLFLRQRAFGAYTLPMYGVINPDRLDRGMRKITAERLLESTELPYFACTTNLNTKTLDLIRTGDAWRAMRMSCAIPGALPAYVHEGMVMVDGGVMNNFPTRVGRELFGGEIVGLSYQLGQARKLKARYEDRPTLWRALAQRVGLARRNDFPTLGKVFSKTLVIGASQEMASAVAQTDHLFCPQVPASLNYTNFAMHDRLFEVGYQYGVERLQELERKASGVDG